MSRTHRRTLTAGAAAVAGALALGAVPAAAQTSPGIARVEVTVTRAAIERAAYGLTDNGRLVTFDLDNPSRTVRPVRITGLPSGATVVGIDERPKTGDLYAVVRAADGAGSFYLVDPATGRATLGAALVSTTGAPVVLTDGLYGVDFNPVADAIRIIGDAGQNLRALPSARTVSGTARDIGTTFTDGTISYEAISASPRPAALGIHASAYTNNLAAPTATQLFNIDTTLEDLTLQNPPNDGTQVAVADVALDGRAVQGFDITTSGTTNEAYVAVATPDRAIRRLLDKLLAVLGIQLPPRATPTELAELDLTTGALTKIGTIGGGPTLVDFAIDTPAPTTP